VILHVRGQVDSPRYDHYELFLGTECGKAKILNPPLAPQLVSFGELAARWDGMGLIVSSKAPDVERLLAGERQQLLMAAAISVAIVVLVHGLGQTRSTRLRPSSTRWRLALSIGQGALLGVVALFCGLSSNLAKSGEGLLANAEGVRSVRQAHLGGFLPLVSASQVRRLVDGDATIVDARFPPDYKAGHLKGAVSIPVDANDTQFKVVTKDLPKTRRVVVYGQSKGCHFAHQVAVRLVGQGFTDVSVFKGGWTEWAARNGHPAAKETAKADGNPRNQS
jgi:rhodanese-related sulfurtransferase